MQMRKIKGQNKINNIISNWNKLKKMLQHKWNKWEIIVFSFYHIKSMLERCENNHVFWKFIVYIELNNYIS